MRSDNQNVELNDDGTPRRKYEAEDASDNKAIQRSTIGMVVASALILVKNILSGGQASHASPGPERIATESNEVDIEHKFGLTEAVSPDPLDLPIDPPKEASTEDGPAVVKKAFKGGGSLYGNGGPTDLVSFTPEGLAFNDNETLYGATPGTAIAPFPTDSGGTGQLLRSGDGGGFGSGGSGGSGGSSADQSGSGNFDDGVLDGSGQGNSGSGSGPGGAIPQSPEDDDEDDDDTGYPPFQANRLPTVAGPVTLSSLLMNQAVLITIADLLQRASDPDGDALRITNLQASSGTLTAQADGNWLFTPAENDTTEVTFTYAIGDGAGSIGQTAFLDLVAPADKTIVGTEGADRLVGTPFMDVIDARGGDDTVIGRESADTIYGGDGNDRIIAGDGDDVVFAGAGDDVVFAGSGNDAVFGGSGNDIMFGDDGKDALFGEDGDDELDGGAGSDVVAGGADDDVIIGTADQVSDVYDGGAGENDTYKILVSAPPVAATSAETVEESGFSIPLPLVEETGEGSVSAATQRDTRHDVEVDLVAGTARGELIGNDTLRNIENVESGSGNDEISGDAEANRLEGGAGDDLIDGRGGNDLLRGDAGDDTLTGGAGNDRVSGGDGHDTVVASVADGNDIYNGGSGADTYDASATTANLAVDLAADTASSTDVGADTVQGIENVKSGSGDDTISGDAQANLLEGGAGNDQVSGGDGNDTIIATVGDGNDVYNGGAGTDTYDASATTADAVFDLLAGRATSAEIGDDEIVSFEIVTGSRGDDIIIANLEVNSLSGGSGNDVFVFGSSAAIGSGSGSRDKILDFDVGDRIDIQELGNEFADVIEDTFGDQDMRKFVLIDEQAEFTKPGQMRFRYDEFDGETVTILQGNLDGDAAAEFELELTGRHELRDEDFRYSDN